MPEGYEEKSQTVKVPKNTGVDGFLHTLKGILGLRNVRSINIDAKGVVNYTRYVKAGEPDSPIGIDYAGLEPWAIIRNAELEEVSLPFGTPAPSVIANLFNMVTREGLVPIAFATGAASDFWEWHEVTAGVRLMRKAVAYGLPIYVDRQIPDQALVLCAAHVRGSLVDCHRFIKATMAVPVVDAVPPVTEVQIL